MRAVSAFVELSSKFCNCCVFMGFLSKTSLLECLGQFIELSRSDRNGGILKLLSFIELTLKMGLSEELSRCVPKLVP